MKPPWLLVVEDEESDALILREALAAAKGCSSCRLEVAATSAAGLELLRKSVAAGAPPALVLLDLRLPGESGFKFLERLRADPALPLLPVIVLTTSRSHTDVREAYARGANAFVVKPSGFDDCVRLVESLLGFWLGHALLPTRVD